MRLLYLWQFFKYLIMHDDVTLGISLQLLNLIMLPIMMMTRANNSNITTLVS